MLKKILQNYFRAYLCSPKKLNRFQGTGVYPPRRMVQSRPIYIGRVIGSRSRIDT